MDFNALRRHLLVGLTLAGHFLYAGIIFGWGSLQIIYEEEGILNDVCGVEHSCSAQKTRLTFVYTVGSSVFIFMALFSGVVADFYGPAKTAMVGGALISLSMLLFGIAGKQQEAMYVMAAVCSGMGSSLVYMCGFPLGCLVEPESMSMVMTSLNCLFDASASVFLLVYYLYKGGVGISEIFIGASILAFVIYESVAVLWFMSEDELYNKTKNLDQNTELARNSNDGVEVSGLDVEVEMVIKESNPSPSATPEPESLPQSPVNQSSQSLIAVQSTSRKDDTLGLEEGMGNNNGGYSPVSEQGLETTDRTKSKAYAHNLSLRSLVFRTPFLFVLVFASLNITRVNAYFGTIFDVLTALGDGDHGYLYTQLFFIIVPLSFLFIPVIGYAMSTYGLVNSFHVVNLLSAVTFGVSLIPSLELQIVSFVCFSIYRGYLFSCLGAYFVKFYGIQSAGRMFGMMSFLSSSVSFLLYPAYLLVTIYDNGSVFYIQLAMLLLAIPCYFAIELILRGAYERYPFADTTVVE